MSDDKTEKEKLDEIISLNSELQKKYILQQEKLKQAMAANKAFQTQQENV